MTGILKDKIALITGASRGIGSAVAKRYAAEGAHVILLARTVGGLEELDDEIQSAGGKTTLVPCDLRQFDKIDELGAVVAERFGKLDILVGNAGVLGELTPVSHITPKVWQEVMDINVTANYRLIRSFDPLLKLSDAGRALFVTSGVAPSHFAYWGAYSASKAALEKLIYVYAEETKKTNLRVNLVDPGVVRTKMRETAMPGEDPNTLPAPEAITDVFVDLATNNCQKHGEVVSVTIKKAS